MLADVQVPAQLEVQVPAQLDVCAGSCSPGLCLSSAPELSRKAALLCPLCAQAEATRLVAAQVCQ